MGTRKTKRETSQQRMTRACDRRVHRIKGLLIALTQRIEMIEPEAEHEQDRLLPRPELLPGNLQPQRGGRRRPDPRLG